MENKIKKINLIFAKSKNNVIGQNNSMPWYIPEELSFFKKKTLNKVIIMGKNTFDSLGGQTLPNRINIVISRTLTPQDIKDKNFLIYKSLEEAIISYKDSEIFIIGGTKLANYAIEKNYIKNIFMTIVDIIINGDNLTHAPKFNEEDYVMLHLMTKNENMVDKIKFSVFEFIKVI